MGLMDILSNASQGFSNWLGEGETEPDANILGRIARRVGRGAYQANEALNDVIDPKVPVQYTDVEDMLKGYSLPTEAQPDWKLKGQVEQVRPGQKLAGEISGSAVPGTPISGVPVPRYGYIRVGPNDIEAADEMLKRIKEVVPGMDQVMLRSNKEYRIRPETEATARANYEPYHGPAWKSVGGWNEGIFSPTTPGKPPVETGGTLSYVDRPRSLNSKVEIITHEGGHNLQRVDTPAGVDATVPGLEYTPERLSQLTQGGLYSSNELGRELFANYVSGPEKYAKVKDMNAFYNWYQDNILNNPALKKEPMYLIDPSIEGKPGPVMTRKDWDLQRAKEERYAEQNRAKEEANRAYRMQKQQRQSMKSTNPPAPDLSSGSIEDMEKAFNYALKQYTPMHTDNPILKEAKNKRMQSFMDWWQRSSDTEKRDFVKALPKEAAPVKPEVAPYHPEASGRGFSEEQYASEKERLKALHTRLRSQSGKLRRAPDIEPEEINFRPYKGFIDDQAAEHIFSKYKEHPDVAKEKFGKSVDDILNQGGVRFGAYPDELSIEFNPAHENSIYNALNVLKNHRQPHHNVMLDVMNEPKGGGFFYSDIPTSEIAARIRAYLKKR